MIRSVLFAALLFVIGVLHAQSNWYVSDSLGADNLNSDNGKSVLAPLKTISYAIKTAWNPGDTIFIMNGTYRNTGYGTGAVNNPAVVRLYNSDNIQSSENAWLVIRNYPGHTPKVQFDGEGGIVINSTSYVEISGLEIEGPNQGITANEAEGNRLLKDNYFSGRGIAFWGNPYPHHIRLHHLKVHDCPNSGLRINNGDYCDISYNEVYNCTWWSSDAESAVVLAQSKDFDDEDTIKMIMSHNLVHDNRNFIPYYNPNYAVSSDCYGNECQDYIIDGSGVYITRNNPGSPSQSSTDYTHGWFYFANNITYNNGINGLVVHKTDRTIVTNNLAYQNGTVDTSEGRQNAGGITIHTSDDVYMYNNISWVRNATDFTYQIYGGSVYAASNNIGVNGNSAFDPSEYLDLPLLDAGMLFLDTAIADFHLTSTNAAIDAGTSHMDLPDFDFDGNTRIGNSDIGPYEYQPLLHVFENRTGLEHGYPNPTKGVVYLPSTNSFTVATPLGKLVAKGSGRVADLSNLPLGVYHIIQDGSFYKVVKN